MSYHLNSPIEMMLEGLQWVAVPENPDALNNGGLPYVTHQGKLDLFGIKVNCYRLSNGMAVIDEEGMSSILGLLAPAK